MATIRKQIRDGYRQALIERCPSVSGRVYGQRKPRLGKGLTPCLSVYFGDGNSTPITANAPRIMDERVELVVVGYSDLDGEELEDILDVIAAEVEVAVTGERLGGIVKSITRQRVRMPDPTDKDSPQGVIALGFEVNWYGIEGRPNEHR